MKQTFLYILALLFLFSACAEKEDNTPSYADTDRLETLIDKDIKAINDFKEAYGTYILYKFDKNLDFAYQFEQASNWTKATLANIEKDDAASAIDFLNQKVFCCYNDQYKKELFPRKLLLVEGITSSSELGLSVPKNGKHTAVANINSVTFAKMSKADIKKMLDDEDELAYACNEMHRALIADYMVKARGEYPVGEEYLAYSLNDYASLMNSSRKNAAQLLKEDENFFYNHGFFFPEDDEATYFPAAEEDIIAFISNLITMDKETANMLFDMPLMSAKMHHIAVGLQEKGVDVMAINPNAEQFLTMEFVQPASMFAEDVVTDNSKATLPVTIFKGSHALDRLEISINGQEINSIDLSQYDKMRNVISIELDNLKKGANAITLKLYEEGRNKPSAIINTGVSYATMDEVAGFTIKCSNDHEDVYRRIKFSVGNGGDVDNEQNPDLTTISFEKHGYLDRYFMEIDAEYNYWKMYKKDGRVDKIVEYKQDGFNEDYTAPLFKLTGTYTFHYNADGELTEVTLAKGDGKVETIVSDVVYVAGRITRYNYNGKIYEPAYAEVNGITARVDCLDENMSGKKFGFDGTEDLNPYYMPELPAVLPGSISEVPLQILYSRYLFKSLEGVWNGGWTRNISDKINYAEVEQNGETWTYRFKLK